MESVNLLCQIAFVANKFEIILLLLYSILKQKNYMCKESRLSDLKNKEDPIKIRETLHIIICKY